MKRRILSLFMILAFVLVTLAGCGAGGGSPIKFTRSNEEEQLLESGYYEVCDEGGELVGYLRVTSSKIVVYNGNGSEKDSLRYDYNAKKGIYDLDDGELFGCEEFTVEKSQKALTLITEDDDEYTLKEIDKSDLPSGGGEDTSDPTSGSPGGEEPASGYIELPVGCYASYKEDGSSLVGYFKVMSNTMIAYGADGKVEAQYTYSYDRDGQCILELNSGDAVIYRFTYQGDHYYMTSGSTFLLAPISESEIPALQEPFSIGDNDSIALYAWLPDMLYKNLTQIEYDGGGLILQSEYTGAYNSASVVLGFEGVLYSDDVLKTSISNVQASYSGNYSSTADMMFCYFRDSVINANEINPNDTHEGSVTINELPWRYWEILTDTKTIGMLFWMGNNDMAIISVSWESAVSGATVGLDDLYLDIMNSVTLYYVS